MVRTSGSTVWEVDLTRGQWFEIDDDESSLDVCIVAPADRSGEHVLRSNGTTDVVRLVTRTSVGHSPLPLPEGELPGLRDCVFSVEFNLRSELFGALRLAYDVGRDGFRLTSLRDQVDLVIGGTLDAAVGFASGENSLDSVLADSGNVDGHFAFISALTGCLDEPARTNGRHMAFTGVRLAERHGPALRTAIADASSKSGAVPRRMTRG